MALTHSYLLALLEYSPLSGILTWKIRRSQGTKAGFSAGSIDGNGRLMVMIDGVSYHAGRLIWFWMTSNWPTHKIDHEDRNPLNNRWENLRDVTQAINNQNRSLNINNKSGVRGVYWNTRQKRWHAQIALNRKKIHLGWYVSLQDAIEARKKAESQLWNLPKERVAISL